MKPTNLATLLTTATLLLATGCTNTLSTITRNLAKDGAIVSVPTPYGHPAIRIGTTTNSVIVLPDGTVKVNAK